MSRRIENEDENETAIRRLCDDWSQALRDKDVERLWSLTARDFVAFDLAPPLQHGAEQKQEIAAWFRTWEGPLGYDLHDARVAAGADAAFLYGLVRLRGRRTSGDGVDMWFRATLCCRKQDGHWKVAHEHTSVPFYMDGSYRAAVDLAPELEAGA
jgi:ketosteroid isomerase-like protein